MNFLQLCQRLRQECGVAGDGPATVSGQTGMLKKLVDWTNQSWVDIQNMREDWTWLRSSLSFNLTIGQTDYTQADLSVDVKSWDLASFRLYENVADEAYLDYVAYNAWMRDWGIGSQTAARPKQFTLGANQMLKFGPKPDKAYSVTCEYFAQPTEMSATTDTPALPSHYHMAIVWLAAMKYAQAEEAWEFYRSVQQEFKRVYDALEQTQRPGIGFAYVPLA